MTDHYLPPLIVPLDTIISFDIGIVNLVLAALIHKLRVKRLMPAVKSFLLPVGGLSLAYSGFALVSAWAPTLVVFYGPAIFYSPWVAAAAVVLAIILYLIRKWRRDIYGAIEIIGALISLVVYASTSTGTVGSRVATLLGGIYFLIRGLDNAEQGKTHLAAAQYLRWIFSKKGAVAVLPALFVIFTLGAIAAFAPADRFVQPPFFGGAHGEQVPVSATQCGQAFVVCDEAAWRERERLMKAGPAARAAAERDAEQRMMDRAKKR